MTTLPKATPLPKIPPLPKDLHKLHPSQAVKAIQEFANKLRPASVRASKEEVKASTRLRVAEIKAAVNARKAARLAAAAANKGGK